MRFTRVLGFVSAALVAGSFAVAGVATPASGSTDALGTVNVCPAAKLAKFAAGGFTNEAFSTPAVGNLFGNGVPYAVVGEVDGSVHWWSLDGHCSTGYFVAGGKIEASPVLVDLNHDGHLDVLIATMTGRVVAFTPSLSNKVIFNVYTHYQNFATPAVGDLFNNGQLDVVEPSTDQHLYAWNSAGQLLHGFPVMFGDTGFSSPTLADLTGNGHLDIIFGFDCAGVQGQWCYPNHGGYLAAVSATGAWLWKHFFLGQTVWSSPAVGDLNGDGKPDIVVGTGNMPCTPAPGQTSMCGGREVYAVNAAGQTLSGWPVATTGRTTSSPAIGDVLGNGRLQVVISDDSGYLYLLNGTGGSPVWKKCIYQSCPSSNPGPHPSAVIADLFANGNQEVLSSGEGATGLYAFNKYGQSVYVAPKSIFHSVSSAPTVTEVNGQTMVVSATIYYPNGASYPGGGYLGMWTTGTRLGYSPWPTFKRTSLREGTLIDQEPVSPVNGSVYLQDPSTLDLGVQPFAAPMSRFGSYTASGPAAVVTSVHGTYEFIRGMNNDMYYCVLSGSTCAEHSLGGAWTAAPSAALLGNGSTIAVADRGTNGYAYVLSFNTLNNTFSGWTSLGGSTIGQVSVASLGSGTNALVGVTATSGAEFIKSRIGTSWGGWLNQGGKSAVGPAVVAQSPGHVLFVQTGTNHVLYSRGCTASGCSGTWNGTWGGDVYSSPSVYQSGTTTKVFGMWADGRVYTRSYTAGSGLSGWAALP